MFPQELQIERSEWEMNSYNVCTLYNITMCAFLKAAGENQEGLQQIQKEL